MLKAVNNKQWINKIRLAYCCNLHCKLSLVKWIKYLQTVCHQIIKAKTGKKSNVKINKVPRSHYSMEQTGVWHNNTQNTKQNANQHVTVSMATDLLGQSNNLLYWLAACFQNQHEMQKNTCYSTYYLNSE